MHGIAAAAVDLADARGLAAVTMRSLAAAVGVSAPGLYRYIASRDEIVVHMVDLVSADVEHPPPSGDWVHDFTVVAERQRDLYRAHPWLAEAVTSLRVMGPHVLDHLDWGLAVLAQVEAPPSRKMEAIALANGIVPAVMGRVCPHPCEDNCNRKEKDGSVAINCLERFIGDWGLEKSLALGKLEGRPPSRSA